MKGEFKNIPLFDATVGLKRILSKWLKPHHSLSCVVIVASRVINNSILLHHKSFLIRFFLCKCFRDRLHLSTDFSIPMTMFVASLRVHSPLVNKLYRTIIKPPQIHQQPQYHLCSVGCGGNGNWRKIAIDTIFFLYLKSRHPTFYCWILHSAVYTQTKKVLKDKAQLSRRRGHDWDIQCNRWPTLRFRF